MSINLSSILPIENLKEYKLHLACWNGKDHPLDVFIRSREEWKGWNTWGGNKDYFNRDYIFALIEFEPDIWLFGGIYKILSRHYKNNQHSYEGELLKDSQELIGRLKVSLKRPGRIKAFKLENFYNDIIVSEILKECYTGENFCGYENINHPFYRLEMIFRNNKQDRRAALKNVKGVYLITDTSNGKRYVGSAYGDSGIWSRWACYMGTGHGWNDELTKLINKEGIEYAKDNFKFAILEYRSMKTDDKVIIKRENYWKNVLLSVGQFGYNKN